MRLGKGAAGRIDYYGRRQNRQDVLNIRLGQGAAGRIGYHGRRWNWQDDLNIRLDRELQDVFIIMVGDGTGRTF